MGKDPFAAVEMNYSRSMHAAVEAMVGEWACVDRLVDRSGNVCLSPHANDGAIERFDLERSLIDKVVVHRGSGVAVEAFQSLNDLLGNKRFKRNTVSMCNRFGFLHSGKDKVQCLGGGE